MPYTPQQNGIAERITETLVTAARAAFNIAHGLPITFWEDDVRDAEFKHNC